MQYIIDVSLSHCSAVASAAGERPGGDEGGRDAARDAHGREGPRGDAEQAGGADDGDGDRREEQQKTRQRPAVLFWHGHAEKVFYRPPGLTRTRKLM
eukprot:scaffold33503_cov29-Prasinocladus_malaysianus.AAC.1